MATHSRETTFVTGAAGFIGAHLVKLLVARRHRVFGLTESAEAAARLRRVGGVPVMGNLREPGPWQDEVGAEWVFHLPPQAIPGLHVTRRAAANVTQTRVSMDAHLLDAVASGPTRRVVYVADTSCYGATEGQRAATEDAPPHPSAWGHCLSPALDRIDGYVVAGEPIVAAFPGWVYGNGGWFREYVIKPVMAGRRVLLFGHTGPWVSPIHVEDCARALVHLAGQGEVGGRYFLVNRDAIRLHAFVEGFARHAGRPLRVFRMPAAAARYMVGPLLADYLQSDAVFSNIRLRATGFRFRYPTIDEGLEQVVGDLHV